MPSILASFLWLSFIRSSFRLLLRTSWVFSVLWRLYVGFGHWTPSFSRRRPSCRWTDAFVYYLDWIFFGIVGRLSTNQEHIPRFALYFHDWSPWYSFIRRCLVVFAVVDNLVEVVVFAGVVVDMIYLYTLFLDNFVRVDCIAHSYHSYAVVCTHF